MKRLAVLWLAAVIAVATGASAQSSYTETFSTDTYLDAGATTADWNTATGELKLNPFQMSQVGFLSSAIYAQRVTVEGDFAYVGGGNQGLLIVDISTPSAPTLEWSFNTSGYTRGIDIEGDMLYAADGLGGFLVYDISNPVAPVSVGSFNTAGYTWNIDVDGDRAYVADSQDGLKVFNVSNPAAPALIATFPTLSNVYDVEVVGDIAYLADGSQGVKAVDISDPTTPVLLGSLDTTGTTRSIDVDGDHIYAAELSLGVKVYDCSDPTAITLAGQYNSLGSTETVAVHGDRAYAADASGGFLVLDVSDPTIPSLHMSDTSITDARGVAAFGDHVVVIDDNSGLYVMKTAETAAIAHVADLASGVGATDQRVSGNLLVQVHGSGALQLVDVSDPAAPVLVSSLAHTTSFNAVDLVGDFAFAADDSGFVVFDVSDPVTPVQVGAVRLGSPLEDIDVEGNYAYAAGTGLGFVIANVTDPTSPFFLTNVPVVPDPTAVVADGRKAYLMDTTGYISILDISYPVLATEIGAYSIGGDARDLDIQDEILYVVRRSAGLYLVDVSEPSTPFSLGSYYSVGWTSQVVVDGDYAYLASGYSGVLMLDVSNTMSPGYVGNYDHPSRSFNSVAVDGHHVYAGSTYPLTVLKAHQDEVDVANNVGQSTSIPIYEDPILARVVPVGTGTADWELSLDHGSTWVPVSTDSWAHFDDTNSFVRFRGTLGWSPAGPASFDDLTIEWLTENPSISGVEDIPADQGGQVRLSWLRSGRDWVGDGQQITEYAVYRQVDGGAKAAAVPVDDATMSPAVRRHAETVAAAGWDYVATVPVRVEDEYSVVVPTLADSTVAGGQHLTTFMVSAMTATPGVFFDSEPGSGYSVDNLAPTAPAALALAAGVLTWDEPVDADFNYFTVYGSDTAELTPSAVVVSYTVDPTADVTGGGHAWYLVTATDFAGNESSAAAADAATGIGDMPTAFRFEGAAPNPFNPATTLAFSIPRRADVRVEIYDVAGRLMDRPFEGALSAGRHEVTWLGRNADGEAAPSGVYVCRITAGGEVVTGSMTLMK